MPQKKLSDPLSHHSKMSSVASSFLPNHMEGPFPRSQTFWRGPREFKGPGVGTFEPQREGRYGQTEQVEKDMQAPGLCRPQPPTSLC